MFFCKYNDPPYVKAEKVDVMVRLASESTIDMLLSELREYAAEVDVDFVRRAVRAIGQCAIKIPAATERCVQVLLELISTRVSYVVQEATVVAKDIFRKYPNQYIGIIPALCANLEEIDEPEAKAALVWIIGEYAERIENSAEQLELCLDEFTEDPSAVQFQTLTAIVKLFLKKPESAVAQRIVQTVLDRATRECDNADLRDRAFIYWRLLSSGDTDASRAVVLAPPPPVEIPTTSVPRAVLDELISELSSLSSVYHKPASTFIGGGRMGIDKMQAISNLSDEATRRHAIATVAQGEKAENLLDFGDDDAPSQAAHGAAAQNLGDLLGDDLFAPAPAPAPAPQAPQSSLGDLMGVYVHANQVRCASASTRRASATPRRPTWAYVDDSRPTTENSERQPQSAAASRAPAQTAAPSPPSRSARSCWSVATHTHRCDPCASDTASTLA